uniref:Trace amine associated receptor 1 n=1 Tax=Acanthochromis polyacanthus TaxID=80966 RepID=A0A3Q1F4V7_9TELE
MDPEVTVNSSYVVSAIHPCYESNNASYIFTSNPSIICVLLYMFLGSLSVVTICGNLLVIISIIYFKQLHIPTNYLILSLAVADLLVGIVVFPFSMAFTVTSCWYYEGLFCKVRGSFDVTLSTASIMNLCCISIDRYYAVCQPLTYRSKMNSRVVIVMILVSWGVAALIGIGIIVAGFNQGKCEDSCLIDALISTTLVLSSSPSSCSISSLSCSSSSSRALNMGDPGPEWSSSLAGVSIVLSNSPATAVCCSVRRRLKTNLSIFDQLTNVKFVTSDNKPLTKIRGRLSLSTLT